MQVKVLNTYRQNDVDFVNALLKLNKLAKVVLDKSVMLEDELVLLEIYKNNYRIMTDLLRGEVGTQNLIIPWNFPIDEKTEEQSAIVLEVDFENDGHIYQVMDIEFDADKTAILQIEKFA